MPDLSPITAIDPEATDRPVKPALWRGWRGRCPSCGEGRMLEGYLKVRPACPACGETFSHHRADDGPAYMTILVVGHLMAPLLMWAFVEFRPSPLVLVAIFTAGCVGLSLFLLPRFKGALVALQWAKRMHGFGVQDGRD
ncbi:DUF983 domain-containing protein [Frigidibacter sp. SD6-1]|uniref:DUF983 domain-containing protein n=1 Tax=Frigidibacter sp. SD6-1 TaxID=3032581 RepID=UPI0024DF9046|nr:DUF983 domain-containing protein [Frigidibacter sp. SD6-1]